MKPGKYVVRHFKVSGNLLNQLAKGAIFVIVLLLSGASNAQELPNILWISVEDISPDLGSYGDKLAHTPELDRLADTGVRYINAIADAPVCAVARATIITGMYPTSFGAQHMRTTARMPKGFQYFPQLLRVGGYYCTNNEKEDYNLDYDSKSIWDESGRNAHWRNRSDKTQPFFAIFNLKMTHESCINSKEKHDRVTKDLPAELRADPKSLILPPYYPDTELVRELWARHYDNISMMDITVGEILDQLEEDGLKENTIILFFSDHGTGSPRHKRWLYDAGVKVPLIVYAPEKYQHLLTSAPGNSTDELVCFIDLAPTVLNLAGVKIPENMQGRAFLGSNLKPERAYAYSARDRMDERNDIQRSVRSKNFKYIRYYEPYKPYTQFMNTPEQGDIMKAIRLASDRGTLPEAGEHILLERKPEEELFDLLNDPWELNNLAADPMFASALEEMRAAHSRWSDNTKDSGLIPESIIRDLEQKYDQSIYTILRTQPIPIHEIRMVALSKDPVFLTSELNHENEIVRYWAAQSLGNIPEYKSMPQTVERLKELMQDQTPAVQIAAARALCKTSHFKQPVKLLIDQLNNGDEWVRLLAAQILDEIGDKARPAEKELRKRIDEDSNKYVVRVANHTLNALNGTDNTVN